jgi:hypothetical protein
MMGDGCRGELLDRARRGSLGAPDRLALDAHLAACGACRLSHDVSGDFDDADVVDVADGARLRSLSDAARRWTAGAGRGGRRVERPRRYARAIAVAASLVVFGGSASAAVWWWRQPERDAALAVAVPLAGHGTTAKATVPITRTTAPAETPPVAEPVGPPRAVARARQISRSRVAHDTAPDAATLLRAASAARRNRETDRAIALYRQLRRAFPGSPEATVSAIPLGRLLLDAGAPEAALAEFDTYLRESGGGPLVSEALYGRGRAAAATGDRSVERQTWQRLLVEHPGSAYAPHARERLNAGL